MVNKMNFQNPNFWGFGVLVVDIWWVETPKRYHFRVFTYAFTSTTGLQEKFLV